MIPCLIPCTENEQLCVKAIIKFVNIAKLCLHFHNYYTAMSIVGGLRYSAVRALLAWKSVPQKAKDVLHAFDTRLMCFDMCVPGWL
jgi:hypothetical protein